MLAIALSMVLHGSPNVRGLELIASVPLPVETNATYAFGTVLGKAPSDSIAFSIHVPSKNSPVVLRFDGVTKEIETLPGWFGSQKDCDVGLLNVVHLEQYPERRLTGAAAETIYDVATGRRLSDIHGSIDRVGFLGVERYRPTYSGKKEPIENRHPRVFDVRSGDLGGRIGRFQNNFDFIGWLAWDDGKQRLVATYMDGKRGLGVVLFRAAGPGFFRGPSVEITDNQMGFDRIIGNPGEKLFVVQYSTNRRAYFKTLTRNLDATPFQLGKILDVSDHGVLGREVLEVLEAGYTRDGPIGCWDPMSGKLLWTIASDDVRGVWLEKYALVGETLLHASTGRVFSTLPSDRMFLAARGNTMWLVTNQSPRQLEVWRIND